MQVTGVATVLLSLALASLPLFESEKHASFTQSPCPNPLPREPLVLYEVAGGTLTGPVDYFLTVYGDGSARLSSSLGGSMGSSQYNVLSAAAVETLRADLVSAGALTHCDQPDFTNDVPLQTLTVFRSGPGRRSNTFSWFTSDGSLADVQATLDAFIGAHFVPPPGGDGDS